MTAEIPLVCRARVPLNVWRMANGKLQTSTKGVFQLCMTRKTISAMVLLVIILAIIASMIAVHLVRRLLGAIRTHGQVEEPVHHSYEEDAGTIEASPANDRVGGDILAEMQIHKQLYFRLQNLEQYPDILPQARDMLISLFSEVLLEALKEPEMNILSIKQYSQDDLTKFQREKDDKLMEQWEQYLARRASGSPREMFEDKTEAEWWLTQCCPVKYVDGAWLGHVNKITTPFALRRVMKDVWQVLSEELGDGDLEKNHVYIYSELIKVINPGLPAGDTADFILPHNQLDEPKVWKAAIAQLLISMFPHQFLPEILGFNMHYEAITLETLKVARELKEVRIDPYYFLLHISIDNADSGHTAMAMGAVIKYLELVKSKHGDLAMQQAWKRVQVGYILSDGLPTAPTPTSVRDVANTLPVGKLESQLIDIFKAKAAVAHKIHCGSKIKIGRHKLFDWLEPARFLVSKQWQIDFLHDLSNAKPWVLKGDSKQSRLIKELSWKGKMFGSFTETEVKVVTEWIKSLGPQDEDSKFYWRFINQLEIPSYKILEGLDIRVDHPVFQCLPGKELFTQELPPTCLSATPIIFDPTGVLNNSRLISLWFTHPCLLENFVYCPSKAATRIGCAVLRVLRAQSGFYVEGPLVSGMDEVRRTENIGLVELGLEIVKKLEPGVDEPTCLKDVLDTWPGSGLALQMLHLCQRPIENTGLLLGLAMAFVDLHEAIAGSYWLLPANTRTLQDIARRERENLRICLEELQSAGSHYLDFWRGYCLARADIEMCFERDNAA